MKLGKKLLALALAGALALSVLTACADSGNGEIKGVKLAKLLSLSEREDIRYDSSLNKTAEAAMNAVKAQLGKEVAIYGDYTDTVTMDNAIGCYYGTLLWNNYFTDAGDGLQNALKTISRESFALVALVNTKDLKNEQYALADLIWDNGAILSNSSYPRYFANMGYYESGDYLLVIMVEEGELPSTTPQSTPA